MSKHDGLVRGSVELECMSFVEFYSCRKDDALLCRPDEDVAVGSLGKIKPIGIVKRAAA
jgi:hypothetical protein